MHRRTFSPAAPNISEKVKSHYEFLLYRICVFAARSCFTSTTVLIHSYRSYSISSSTKFLPLHEHRHICQSRAKPSKSLVGMGNERLISQRIFARCNNREHREKRIKGKVCLQKLRRNELRTMIEKLNATNVTLSYAN